MKNSKKKQSKPKNLSDLMALSTSNIGEIDCDLKIEVDDQAWQAYTAHINDSEFLLYCDKGTASFVIDTYGDRKTCELVDWETE